MWSDPEDLLLSQDLIFVGGGSVANMMAVWRVHGIDVILRKAWQAGVVLAGSSAGGICSFEGGTTDSFGRQLRAFTDGLGLLNGSYCPHYDAEPGRRPLYHQLVLGRHAVGRRRLRQRRRRALHRRHARRGDLRPAGRGHLPGGAGHHRDTRGDPLPRRRLPV